jgi:hypothetical protein
LPGGGKGEKPRATLTAGAAMPQFSVRHALAVPRAYDTPTIRNALEIVARAFDTFCKLAEFRPDESRERLRRNVAG